MRARIERATCPANGPGRAITGRAATAVSTRVNAVANNGPDLVEPLPQDLLHGVVDPATGELLGAGDVPLF